MANKLTGPCTWCMLWRDLRIQAEAAAQPAASTAKGSEMEVAVEKKDDDDSSPSKAPGAQA